MTPERWLRIERLLHEALERTPAERRGFLDGACGEDSTLRAEVESLIAAHDERGSFLTVPAVNVLAQALAHQAPRRAVGDQVGQYRIDALIGGGSMGDVWRARDMRLGRDVAIKVLAPGFAADAHRMLRFEQEARALAQLNHPNILTIHAVSTDAGAPYLVTELLEGETLKRHLSTGAPGVDRALDWAIQIVRGLAAAHEKGIVHRDLKPANVFVTRDGVVKILDFGLAKVTRPIEGWTDSTRTAAGSILGTTGYMSPEQARGGTADHRSDLFAVGAILYEMVSGRRAFAHESPFETLDATVNADPPPLTEAPSPVADVVRRCIEKRPEDRFQSALDLLAHLEAARAPVDATSRNVPTRRRVALRWTAALLLAVIATAAGWSLWRYRQPAAVPFAERDVVLVGRVTNATGNPLLEDTLAMALRISLEQSRYVTLLPPARVRDALQRMRRSPDEPLTEDVAREICVREGARVLLAGDVAPLGRELLLTVRVVDPSNGRTVRSATERAASAEQLLPAVDRVASSLRSALGESIPSITGSSRPLAEATTSSLEALRDYTVALQFFTRGQGREAEALLARAIELDPDFARAYAAIGTMYQGYGMIVDRGRAERYFRLALDRLDRVTERERLEIQALYHGAMGRFEQAAAFYRLLVERHPASDEYHYYLGRQHYGLGQFQSAIEEYKAAARLNPTSAETRIRLAGAYRAANDLESARQSYEEAFVLGPSWETDVLQNHQYGWTLAMTGREDAARATFAKMIGAERQKRARGLRSLGLLALYRGRLADARRAFDEATRLNEAERASTSAARDRLYMAEALLLFGRKQEALRALDRGTPPDEPAPDVFIELRYAAVNAIAGRVTAAEHLLARSRPRIAADDPIGGADFERAEAELLLARGIRNRAIDMLRRWNTAASYSDLTRPSLARALRAAGRRDEAIREYEALISTPPPAWEGHVAWGVAHLALGGLYEEAGDAARARATYAALAKVWSDADADLPAVTSLRAAQTRLRQ